ncbi:MAG: FAD-dependent monooxygenase [Rhodocyclaceae bacterium]|nr:FAD-dependent monooxygenase [Rhodocyclaceae bacterium]
MSAPVLIIGGGPAGMTLALALHRSGVPSRIVDARPRGAAQSDARILALSYGSRLILESLGLWRSIPHTPIETIHVSHAGGFGRTVMRAAEAGVPALGYVLSAGALAAALDGELDRLGIEFAAETQAPQDSNAALTVHAEGRVDATTGVISRDYGQHAVICLACGARPHGGIAWERFTPEGPVALLPYEAGYAVVLTCPAEESARIAALEEAAFLSLLQERFGPRVKLTSVGPRQVHPLGLRMRRNIVAERAVWIGNAAQTLHPVAGQGFNLALRDIMELAETLADAPDPGDAALLERYARGRQLDRRATATFTGLLVRLFSNDFGPLKHLRGLGLLALDLLPPARAFLARRMMFGARAW